MREMVEAFELQPGEEFSRTQAIDWFESNFPRIKKATVAAHLTRLSINAPSRIHHSARPEEDDLFFQIDSSRFRLYDPERDPSPIYRESSVVPASQLPEEEESIEVSDSFAYEKDLQNYLAKNLGVVETGLRLYEEEGINGVEYPVGGRFIDILAVDSRGDFVVLELKVSKGYDRVVGQLMRYMAWINENLAEPQQGVRGVIVARELSQDLVLACSLLPNVQLFEYELSLSLKQINASR